MEKLIELSQLVTGIVTPENARALFREGPSDPKAYLLFDGILKNRLKTDAQAARELYGGKPTEKKYQMLKSRVRNRLLQLVFTMDLSKRIKSNYTKAMFDCSKKLFAARQLIILGHRNIVADTIREINKSAEKYQLTEIQISTARLLRDHEVFSGDENKVDAYNSTVQSLKKKIDFELESEQLYQTMRSFLRKAVSLKSTYISKAQSCFEKSQQLVTQNSNPTDLFIKNTHRIAIYYYHFKDDHSKVLEVCNKFERYLKLNPRFADIGVITVINMQRLDTSLYLRKYELGKESAINCAQMFKKGTSNWIVVQEVYFLICLHTRQYLEAYNVLKEVRAFKRFDLYSKDRIERWKIFEAFLSYIMPQRKGRKKFNVHRFVNEVPVFSRDKIGYNFSIIVAQLILLVKAGDFDRVMDRYESLKSYARRYIKKERSPRSYYFVKMLLTMIKYDFDPGKTEAISQKFFDKLRASRIGNQGELETLEVIPYDVLWTDLLKKLKTHRKEGQWA